MKYEGTRNKGTILKACKEKLKSINKGLRIKMGEKKFWQQNQKLEDNKKKTLNSKEIIISNRFP